MIKKCLAGALLLAPVAACAHLADWYISGGMMYINSDTDRTNDEDYSAYLGIGRIFGERFSLEAEYNDYDFDLGEGARVDLDGFNISGRYYFLGNSKTSPYLGLGVGSLSSDSPFGEGSDAYVDLAGGAQYLFGDRWTFRGELRYRFDRDDDALPGVDHFGDWMVNLGLTMALGPRTQPAPPPQSAPQPAPEPEPPQSTFILLPDDDGTVGKIIVSNEQGREEITRPGYAVSVARDGAPGKPQKADEAQVQAVFGDALQAFPDKPLHFELYFEFDSTELVAESRPMIAQIVEAIRNRQPVNISVVGHADAVGSEAYNNRLSERRASVVAHQLIEAGVSRDIVEITAHGESKPAVPTRDNEPEPKNRRVDVTVR